MFKTTLAAALLASTTLLAACAGSGPTLYQPASANFSRGYTETKLEDTRYRISFKGNSLTERETVENYMLFRAAELTLQSGYDTFTIANRDTDADKRTRYTGGLYGPRLSYTYFSPRWGWVNAWDPFWHDSARYQEVTSYEAFAEIVMTKGPKGSDPNAFDARQVSQNLGPAIQRPGGSPAS
jgi:hypothetical protein